MLRDSVGKLVHRFGRRYFQEVTRTGRKPEELWKELASAGFIGVHVSEAYGGGGAGLAEYHVVVEEVAAQGCPILSLVINSIVVPIIQQHGSEALKQTWLPPLAKGSRRLAFAITEPDAGTNTHKISTTARRAGTGWTLSGKKYFISAVDEADALLVVARGETVDVRGRAPLSLFICPDRCQGHCHDEDRYRASSSRNAIHRLFRRGRAR